MTPDFRSTGLEHRERDYAARVDGRRHRLLLLRRQQVGQEYGGESRSTRQHASLSAGLCGYDCRVP